MEDDLSYEASTIPIRDDLVTAHQRAWRRLAQPGTWWTGAQRVAIAAETRQALTCELCQQCQTALTPTAISGTHDHLGALPEPIIDVIHRVCTDAGLLRRFAEAVLEPQAAVSPIRHEVEHTLGAPALVDSAAVIAIFQAVVRIADATGIALEEYKVDLTATLRSALGIDDFLADP